MMIRPEEYYEQYLKGKTAAQIYSTNGHKPRTIYSDNAYLYDFDKFQEPFGIDPGYGENDAGGDE